MLIYVPKQLILGPNEECKINLFHVKVVKTFKTALSHEWEYRFKMLGYHHFSNTLKTAKHFA